MKHITHACNTGGRNGTKYAYYHCSGRNHPCPSTTKEDFEKEFVAYLRKLTPKENVVRAFTELIKEKYDSKIEIIQLQHTAAETQVNLLKKKRQNIIDDRAARVISPELFKEQLSKVENELTVKKVAVAESTLEEIDITTLTEFSYAFLSDLAKAWTRGTLEQKRILVGSMFPKKPTYHFPSYRTAYLASYLKPLQGSNRGQIQHGVADGDRTRDIRLHKPALCH